MTLEQQVTSLNLSKRLKELGVKQESLFYWSNVALDNDNVWKGSEPELTLHYSRIHTPEMAKHIKGAEVVSAFTASELGEMLPKEISEDGMLWFLTTTFRDDGRNWYVWYEANLVGEHRSIYNQFADTEANARAKLLIYLLENKLI